MKKLWNARTCSVYCRAWDAYESGGSTIDTAGAVFEKSLEEAEISFAEYDYLVHLFWDTVTAY